MVTALNTTFKSSSPNITPTFNGTTSVLNTANLVKSTQLTYKDIAAPQVVTFVSSTTPTIKEKVTNGGGISTPTNPASILTSNEPPGGYNLNIQPTPTPTNQAADLKGAFVGTTDATKEIINPYSAGSTTNTETSGGFIDNIIKDIVKANPITTVLLLGGVYLAFIKK
jgi:hypothetical protein